MLLTTIPVMLISDKKNYFDMKYFISLIGRLTFVKNVPSKYYNCGVYLMRSTRRYQKIT